MKLDRNTAYQWCEKLNEANIGDTITIDGLTIEVKDDDGTHCEGCDFYKSGNACPLIVPGIVTPCSPFNNSIGKSLQFKAK